MVDEVYKQKYLKYKKKYLGLVNQIGGAASTTTTTQGKNQKLEGIKQLLKKKEFEYVLQTYTMAPIKKLLNLEKNYFTNSDKINMIEMITLGKNINTDIEILNMIKMIILGNIKTDKDKINLIEMIILGNIKKKDFILSYSTFSADKAGTYSEITKYEQFAEEVKKLSSE